MKHCPQCGGSNFRVMTPVAFPFNGEKITKEEMRSDPDPSSDDQVLCVREVAGSECGWSGLVKDLTDDIDIAELLAHLSPVLGDVEREMDKHKDIDQSAIELFGLVQQAKERVRQAMKQVAAHPTKITVLPEEGDAISLTPGVLHRVEVCGECPMFLLSKDGEDTGDGMCLPEQMQVNGKAEPLDCCPLPFVIMRGDLDANK